jgi:hypothetical protein
MSDNTKRQPAGIPVGGQFAANEHDEASADLSNFLHTEGDETVIRVIESNATDRGVEFTPDGADEPVEVFTDNSPDEWIDTKVELRADGNYNVVYAARDDYSTEYEHTEGDSLEVFRSQWERDAHIQKKLDDGVPADRIFVVDRMEHGQVKYTVLDAWDSKTQDAWDSAPSTVIVIDEEGAGGVTDFRAAADAVAEDYTKWANGDVYGICRGVYDVNGDAVEHEESVWGFIGSEYAEQAIKEGDY